MYTNNILGVYKNIKTAQSIEVPFLHKIGVYKRIYQTLHVNIKIMEDIRGIIEVGIHLPIHIVYFRVVPFLHARGRSSYT
tara:strand:+ start:2041 stop:2280 length:240 start_codon:yes stop_codon:yes gene_type:complete